MSNAIDTLMEAMKVAKAGRPRVGWIPVSRRGSPESWRDS
jgi:hypothetical protein